jgi:hypothetical protein
MGMEMRETIKISGEGNGEITLEVGDDDNLVTLTAVDADSRTDQTMSLAEAKCLRNALSIAILAAEHNVTAFDS